MQVSEKKDGAWVPFKGTDVQVKLLHIAVDKIKEKITRITNFA